ncbi:MAG TPA: L,D-transpeptidase/peptidoglycan binding protein [Solirubrobacteraceae bacterium]
MLVVLGGALYAYDHARADEISAGVKVGGVPLGGLTRAQAQARLERDLLRPLERPVVIHHANKTWKLGPTEARIHADLGAMVDEAVARSRSGGLFSRSWRSLTGGRLDDDLRPMVQFSDAAVIRLVDRVRRSVERPAKDATVKISAAGVTQVPAQDGLAIQASALHRQIRAAITSPTAGRTFVARTHHTDPKVTTDELKHKYETVIVINRNQFRLRLFKDLKLSQTFPIAVGRVGLETPAGQYKIANKAIDPAWHVPNSPWAGKLAGKVIPGDDPTNPIKARWLGVYDGVGIHGTNDDASIGHNASHGCIRMHIPDVEKLYDEVPVGAAIYIA